MYRSLKSTFYIIPACTYTSDYTCVKSYLEKYISLSLSDRVRREKSETALPNCDSDFRSERLSVLLFVLFDTKSH